MADLPQLDTDSGSSGPAVIADSPEAAPVSTATAQTGVDAPDQKVEKRLEDTTKAFKERQAELTHLNQEIAAQKAVQAELAKVREVENKPAGPVNPMEDKEFMESLEDMSTAEALRAYAAKSQQFMGSILDMRDEAFKEQMRQQIGYATDPRVAKLNETITTLSNEPWYAALSQDAKLAVAEKVAGATDDGSGDTIAASGMPVGGTQRVVETQVSAADQEAALKKRADEVFGKLPDYKSSGAPGISFNVTQPNGRR